MYTFFFLHFTVIRTHCIVVMVHNIYIHKYIFLFNLNIFLRFTLFFIVTAVRFALCIQRQFFLTFERKKWHVLTRSLLYSVGMNFKHILNAQFAAFISTDCCKHLFLSAVLKSPIYNTHHHPWTWPLIYAFICITSDIYSERCHVLGK